MARLALLWSRITANRRLAWSLGGALAVLLVGYLALVVTSGGDVPRRTSVLGVDISAMTKQAATARLDTALAAKAKEPLHVVAGGRSGTVDPVAAGLSLDTAATVEAASGRSLNPFTLLRHLLGSSDVRPVVTADPARLQAAVVALAKTLDEPAREGGITFTVSGATAVPVVVKSATGHGIVVADAGAALQDGYLVTPTVSLRVADLVPTVDDAAVQASLTGFAAPAVAAPVRLAVAGRSIPVPPGTFAKFLTLAPSGGALVPDLDVDRLKVALAGPLKGIERPAIDAKFTLTGGSPQIVASAPGVQIASDKLATAFLVVLPKTTDRVVTVPLTTLLPALTTAQANTLGITEKVASFTTHYPYAAYRLQNIHRAADLIDGKVLMPGQVFSLNRAVGERTAANGFAIGTIINGGRFEKDYGGGTSQVATTTFNAAFFAGLKIITHKPHSFYISRYPAGREATVAWPDVDLQFQNDSGHAIVIDSSYTRSSVTVTIWGTKIWDIESLSGSRYNQRAFGTIYDPTAKCVPQGGVQGFDIDVTRVFSHGSTQVRTEKFHTHYNPAAQIYCRANPTPTPTPTASVSPSQSPTPSP